MLTRTDCLTSRLLGWARTFPRIVGALAVFVIALVAARGEVVILKDGFVLQGTVGKEKTRIPDPASGKLILSVNAAGFDYVDEGPKIVFFSTHSKQLGEISKDIKLRPDYRVYKNLITSVKSQDPLPVGGNLLNISDWDAKWRRLIEIKMPLGTERIEQQIVQLDPYFCWISSPTHAWRVGQRTSELGPALVRRLLATHPELLEAPGKIEPLKRLAIAKFLLDAGWLVEAQAELTQLKSLFTAEFSKEEKESFDRLTRELDHAAAEWIVTESEKYLSAGRYEAATELLNRFPAQGVEARLTDRATKLMAVVRTNRERHELAHRRLAEAIEEIRLGPKVSGSLAVGGAAVGPGLPVAPLDGATASLVEAAQIVLAEIHPDTVNRLEQFLSLAAQSESDRRAGRVPRYKPSELLSAAVSGWTKGAISADTHIITALRAWNARNLVLAYQRETGLTARKGLYQRYLAQGVVASVDELLQVIRLLPPADPENLAAPTGERVPISAQVPDGVLRYTQMIPGRLRPLEYFVRLPLEYHHGRAYPVLITLTMPGVPPESLLGGLANEADRNGYILLAPKWDTGLLTGYDYDGDNHVTVTATLRDLIRRFCVDNDRVFLFGIGEGANMAMDVAFSHPDLFAGVIPWCASPRWTNMFMHYWKNAQKLPIYAVTGEHAGRSVELMRAVLKELIFRGHPSLFTVYKGRQLEWFPAEVPVMFDWMGRKKRVGGAAFLNLNPGPIDTNLAFQTMRVTDDRFYWLGVEELGERYRIDLAGGVLQGRNVNPAWVAGDIRNGNEIHVLSVGIKKLNIWLSRDMINWDNPVKVFYNRQPYAGFRSQVLKPDVEVLLEDYHRRGDRRQLVLYRIELRGN